MTKSEHLQLSDKEMALVKEHAKREGITEDEAASQLISHEIQRRMKRKTGKNPAKVYSIRRK